MNTIDATKQFEDRSRRVARQQTARAWVDVICKQHGWKRTELTKEQRESIYRICRDRDNQSHTRMSVETEAFVQQFRLQNPDLGEDEFFAKIYTDPRYIIKDWRPMAPDVLAVFNADLKRKMARHM